MAPNLETESRPEICSGALGHAQRNTDNVRPTELTKFALHRLFLL